MRDKTEDYPLEWVVGRCADGNRKERDHPFRHRSEWMKEAYITDLEPYDAILGGNVESQIILGPATMSKVVSEVWSDGV
jgi:hypothetical protein